jgi:potassium efflux system protein
MESIRLRDFPQAMALLGDILDPGDWIALLQFAWLNLQEDPAAVIGCLFVLLIWMSRRRQIRSRMTFLAEQVSKWTTDRFSYTIEVTVYSLLNALFWPAVLWMFAWRAGTAIQAGPLALQVASGLYRAGAVLFLFGLVFQIIRQSGLARTHFRWREDSRTLLRRHLNWVQPMIVPLAFVISAIDGFGSGTGESVLARMAFIAAMLIAAVFIMRLLRPQSGVFHHIIADSKGRWMERLQYVWYPVAVAIPLGLAVLAALGYFYTARQLEDRFLLTFTMVLGLMLTNQLALRWLYMARRALAIEEVRKRRRAAKEEVKESGTSMTDGEGGIITIDEKKLDISAVNNQTRKLVRSMLGFSFILGIWMIWAQMLPALGMLDRLVVWPNMEVRETVVTTQPLESIIGKDWLSRIPPPFQDPAKPFDRADAATLAGSDPAAVDSVVTVKNLILFLIIVLIIGVVSRNIPGLLEIAVLQKLPLEPSGRYAIVTLTRYVILVIGTVVSFGAIGIGWAQVQWLVAAITLGIGFGLQEIVANFISGIIILFEQPIRVGDTVTVNGVSGSVAKIRMRATTIVDWDRKELIIPNKSFITGDVINWTLSDPVLRLVINVGIAYGSDTQKAEEILLRIANEDPMVMSDPAPSVVFWEFGDSSLTFNLRVYLPHIGEMIRARHELHMNIDKAFREAGIEIAFPQRDIHIRSIVERASPTPDKGTVPPSVDDLLKGQAP